MKRGWGVVATVKAPEDQVLAFVAHHLSLGAAQVWVCFDDPADPAFDRIARLPRVTAIRCTDWYWLLRGGRSARHRSRQIANARHVQRQCRLDWLAHLDVDEFLHAPGPVADILAEVPAAVPTLRMEPFEALHDPGLPDDIFTACRFRGPLRDGWARLRPAIFGPFAGPVSKGSLGHTLGKAFSRPGFPDLALGLHAAFLNRIAIEPPFHPDLRLLHFHAADPVAWRQALPFRLRRGAYHHAEEETLRIFLSRAGDDELDSFYREVMTLTPEKAALLSQHDRLITADLGLRAKVARLLAGDAA
jgi:hypothetical protein